MPHVRLPLLLLALVAGLARGGDEKDPDPIKDRLDLARRVYAADMKAYREKATAWLDDKENVARKAGNKKTVDRLKEERKTFDRTDELPKGAPSEFTGQAATARARVIKEYEAAIRDYTRTREDKEAAVLEKELELVKIGLDPTDLRWLWVHNRGEYRLTKKGEWVEHFTGNRPLKWVEVQRTKDAVILRASWDNRVHLARITAGTVEQKVETDPEYKTLFKGAWRK
jgi:hypothetical protein